MTASEHGRREAARERVLLAGVIRPEQRAVAHLDLGAVTESRRRGRRRFSPSAEDAQHLRPRKAPQRDHHADVGEQVELGFQVGTAGLALLGRRLVGRRRAAHRGGDVRVAQSQPVSPANASGLVGQARPMQRAEQKVARAVAGEDPAGAIAAVRRGRQSDDQNPSRRVAESGHRTPPVGLGAIGGALLTRGLLPPRHQSRAASAVHDALLQLGERRHARLIPPGRRSDLPGQGPRAAHAPETAACRRLPLRAPLPGARGRRLRGSPARSR